MSTNSLAIALIDSTDKILRNALDSIRTSTGADALTNDEWDAAKPTFIAIMEATISNADIQGLKALVDQEAATVANQINSLSATLTIMLDQIEVNRIAAGAIEIDDWPPAIAGKSELNNFTALKTELNS